MLKKTVTYTDYNGVERTETFYFNLTKAEILEMEAEEAGGYSAMLKRIIESKDGATLMKTFKTIILKSYGIKTPDGKGFRKSEEISKEFEQSAAYSEIFMELCTNAEAASDFVTRVMPLNDEQRIALKKTDVTTLPSTSET